MTIHGWGSPISVVQVRDEFGGVTPTSLSQYYSGGPLVAGGTVGYPSGGGAVVIPAGGAISLNNFYGSTSYIPPVIVSCTPSSMYYTDGLGPSFTFPPCTVTVSGGTATAYSWWFSATDGSGTWSVFDGQGTAVASAHVNLPGRATAGATFRCDVTVGGVVWPVASDLYYVWP